MGVSASRMPGVAACGASVENGNTKCTRRTRPRGSVAYSAGARSNVATKPCCSYSMADTRSVTRSLHSAYMNRWRCTARMALSRTRATSCSPASAWRSYSIMVLVSGSRAPTATIVSQSMASASTPCATGRSTSGGARTHTSVVSARVGRARSVAHSPLAMSSSTNCCAYARALVALARVNRVAASGAGSSAAAGAISACLALASSRAARSTRSSWSCAAPSRAVAPAIAHSSMARRSIYSASPTMWFCALLGALAVAHAHTSASIDCAPVADVCPGTRAACLRARHDSCAARAVWKEEERAAWTRRVLVPLQTRCAMQLVDVYFRHAALLPVLAARADAGWDDDYIRVEWYTDTPPQYEPDAALVADTDRMHQLMMAASRTILAECLKDSPPDGANDDYDRFALVDRNALQAHIRAAFLGGDDDYELYVEVTHYWFEVVVRW